MGPLPFREFDPSGDVRIYEHGILPHWRQDHCTYFVTFRQDDALPIAVANEIKYERKIWLAHRGIDIGIPSWKQQLVQLAPDEIRNYERHVGKIVNSKLDQGMGSCVLKRTDASAIVSEAIEFFDGTRVIIGDYVVMPNHVHALMRPMTGYELEDVLFSIKSYTANRLNQLIDKSGRFWQRESYDHIVRNAEQLQAFQDYIRLNPVKVNLPAGSFFYRSAVYAMEEDSY